MEIEKERKQMKIEKAEEKKSKIKHKSTRFGRRVLEPIPKPERTDLCYEWWKGENAYNS